MDSQEEGYNVNLVNGLPPRLQCPLCQKLMRKPLQTSRGEVACSSCYEKNKGDSNICPIDHEVIELDGTIRDRFREREILKLACLCPNAKFGCDWQGSLRFLEDHKAECQSGPIRCTFCTEEMSISEMEQHHKQCLMGNLCPYTSAGCEFKVSKGETLDEHMNKSHLLHAHLANKKISNLESRITSNKETQVDHVDEARRIKNVVNDVSHNLLDVDLRHQLHENTTFDGHMIWKIDNFKTRYQQAVIGKTRALHSAPSFTSRYGYKFCARLYLNGDGMGKGTHMSLFFVLMKSEFDTLLEWPFNKKKVTFTLINQNERQKDLVKFFVVDPNLLSSKKPTKNRNTHSSGYPTFISLKDLREPQAGFVKDDCIYLEIKVDDVVENVNVNLHHQIYPLRFDGNMIWKIDNFETRYQQAVIGKTTALHSAPLFTSRSGYKFCARLYLNGDGMGKGTHMSLFFVLMKSEFDELLEWPFNKQVTFTLINQENRAKDVVETFKANPNSSSFKRPTKQMNIASGCPYFVSQESLNAPQSGFIKNDSLFLIIKVSDCIDNSKENEE